MAETDAAGNTIRDYIYVDGMPLAIIEGNNSYTILPDHLGTPQLITDQNQNIVWQADYEPFGNTDITTASIQNNLRFPGQYYDLESGLNYNKYRYYMPKLGRYLRSDSISLNGGLNTYLYTGANPIMYIDPYGLYCLTNREINAIAGGIGGAFSGALTGAILASPTGPGAAASATIVGLLGGVFGAASGYIFTSSAGDQVASGMVNAAVTATSSPSSTLYGGAVGGATSVYLQEEGFHDTHAGIVGGGTGGFVGSGTAAFLSAAAPDTIPAAISFAFQSALRGGLVGLSGAALSAAVTEALRAGNDCSKDSCR